MTIVLTVLASASDGLALRTVTNIPVLTLVGRHRHIKPVACVLVSLFLAHYLVNGKAADLSL